MKNEKFGTLFETDFGSGFGSYILQQEAEIIIANSTNKHATKLAKVGWWIKFNKFVSYVYSVSNIADISDDHLLHYQRFMFERAESRNINSTTVEQQISFIKSVIKQAREYDNFTSQEFSQFESKCDKQQILPFAKNHCSLYCCFRNRIRCCCCLNQKL